MTEHATRATTPRPESICNQADFVFELDHLRRRAAAGASRQRIGLDSLVRATGIPRSSLHGYLAGTSLPPADRLDTLVLALGATPSEAREWALALDRLFDGALTRRIRVDAELQLPTENARVRSRRARGLHTGPVPLPDRPGGDGANGPIVVHACVCTTWAGSHTYTEPNAGSRRTGFLHAGNNWFLGQAGGGPNPGTTHAPLSHMWLYTQADIAYDSDGGWGWVPANAVANAQCNTPLPGLLQWKRPEMSDASIG
ncbi:hypothetical protein [Allobranchiibius sp. CTAmp26]|uniref:hypothetical protein n=1 Tax=Allobranchiibius sp. CTAmp26 TaxID=2815214 RepID=UPI001AA0C2BB|nr:hypothetical protein [Allobranchiibius sp. CTAmp26]MBO1756148.1 hypothetical protein [Allobranchiibius sp. CTAmp26]